MINRYSAKVVGAASLDPSQEKTLLTIAGGDLRGNVAVFVQSGGNVAFAGDLDDALGTLFRAVAITGGVSAEVARGRTTLAEPSMLSSPNNGTVHGELVLRGRVPSCDSLQIRAWADSTSFIRSPPGLVVVAEMWDGPPDDGEPNPYVLAIKHGTSATVFTGIAPSEILEAVWTNTNASDLWMWVGQDSTSGFLPVAGPFFVGGNGGTFSWQPARPLRTAFAPLFYLSGSATSLTGDNQWQATVLLR